jgi:hypothetical protein
MLSGNEKESINPGARQRQKAAIALFGRRGPLFLMTPEVSSGFTEFSVSYPATRDRPLRDYMSREGRSVAQICCLIDFDDSTEKISPTERVRRRVTWLREARQS